MMDRRQLFKTTFGAMAGVLVFHPFAISRQASGITKLNENLTILNGLGTNVFVLTTNDGMVLVASAAPENAGSLKTRLMEVGGSKRVHTVLNTHFHLENTGGNETLAQAGAKIIAHASTREWMETPYWIPAEGRYQKPRPKAAQ